jgi:N-formylglutamate amidohydrolase
MNPTPFTHHNTTVPKGPVVIAVPHAGRDYPTQLPMLRVPLGMLRALEDRHADRLAAFAIDNGITTLIAQTPRLLIDLNRAESELDPAMVQGGVITGAPLPPRVRGGLGLIPRRIGPVGDIWRGPLDPADVAARISAHHRPWHDTLATLLAGARDRFGAALLIDLHSMPSIEGPGAPSIVIGDRFGRSATPRMTATAEAIAQAAGFRVAINAPYAGGYALDRHGQPRDGIHALQIEIDRATYLDVSHDAPGAGLARMQALVLALATRLGDELSAPQRLAAE